MAAVGQRRTAVGQARKSRRPDPKPRHIDGASALSKLQNENPERSYAWVTAGNRNQIAEYVYAGWTVERYKPGGVSPLGIIDTGDDNGDGLGGLKAGAPIPGPYGTMLMSCSKERKKQIELEGNDGTSGQLDVDALERHIIDNRGGMDPLRGIGGLRRSDGTNYVTAEKDISPLELDEDQS